MSKFAINGLVCDFPACSVAQLHQYQPTPRTRLLAWKLLPPTFNVTILMMLNSIAETGGMERPPYLIEEGQRYVYLLEYPSNSMMEAVTQWLGIFGGYSNYIYKHPYREARAMAIQEADENWKDLVYAKTATGKRPLLDCERTHPELGAGAPLKIPTIPEEDPYLENTKK